MGNEAGHGELGSPISRRELVKRAGVGAAGVALSGGMADKALGAVQVRETADAARKTVVDCWPNAAIRGPALSDLARPNDFEKVLEQIPSDAIVADVVCGPDVDVHVAAIGRFAAAGFTEVYVHQIGPDQEGFSASLPTTSSHVSPEIAWINIDHPPSHTPHQRDIASP